jgi:hypothetical protein
MNEMPAIPDDLQHDYNMAKDASDHYPTWRGEEVIAFIERIGRAERALRDAETRWISVDERLPDPDEEVILTYFNGPHGPFTCAGLRASAEYGGGWYDMSENDLDHCTITHWQPKPNPPARPSQSPEEGH